MTRPYKHHDLGEVECWWRMLVERLPATTTLKAAQTCLKFISPEILTMRSKIGIRLARRRAVVGAHQATEAFGHKTICSGLGTGLGALELILGFMIERARANFILDKAVFIVVAGGYGEEGQRSIG